MRRRSRLEYALRDLYESLVTGDHWFPLPIWRARCEASLRASRRRRGVDDLRRDVIAGLDAATDVISRMPSPELRPVTAATVRDLERDPNSSGEIIALAQELAGKRRQR